MKTRIAILMFLAGLLAFGPASGEQAEPAAPDGTNLLVAYGKALAPDGIRNIPLDYVVTIRNSRTNESLEDIVGRNASGEIAEPGNYEAIFWSQDAYVAEPGDTLFYSVGDAVFAEGTGFLVLTEDHMISGMAYYNIIPDMISAVPDAASATRLLGNHPNPFNPKTTIRFEQNIAGPVTMDLYDARGMLIKHLFAGFQTEGAHDVVWEGRDETGREAPSGVYFVKLQAAGATCRDKITLLR